MQLTIVFSLRQIALGTVFSAPAGHDSSHGKSKSVILGKVHCSCCVKKLSVAKSFFCYLSKGIEISLPVVLTLYLKVALKFTSTEMSCE